MIIERQRLLVTWTLALGMFVIGTTSLSILGVGPALTRDLEIAPGAAGWLVTAFAATFAIAAPASQFALRQRLSPRTLIISGTVILAASLIWTAAASEFSSLLVARIISALGGALITPTSAALAIASVPTERRGATLATVFAGFTLATVGGVPIVTWLTLLMDWRGAMAAIACAAVLFLLLVLLFLPNEKSTAHSSEQAESQGVSYWKPAIILLATTGMLAAQFTVYALMGELLGQKFGVSNKDLPIAILLFGVFGVAGNATAGFLSDRVGASALIWASIASLAALLLTMNASLGAIMGSVVLAGCAFAGTLFATPQQSRLVGLVSKDQHALVLAGNSSASYLGIALGSGLASLLATNVGLDFLPVAALGVLAFTALFNLLMRSPKR